ncbi:expressed protein [Phakopsora pachyrhizi]|uniref:Expressed protein n=1 Tax=Phakopsora pachyrhizi TaxID=170000 RepID=A0AAV0BLR8_PHAPC|nr:expressed protein [Phakopsora pachyrhizi]
MTDQHKETDDGENQRVKQDESADDHSDDQQQQQEVGVISTSQSEGPGADEVRRIQLLLRHLSNDLNNLLRGEATDLRGLEQLLPTTSVEPDKQQQESDKQLRDLSETLKDKRDKIDRLKVYDSDEVERLRRDLSSLEEQSINQRESQRSSINLELEQLQTKLRAEEEKRAKSISLLRAVRTKLVQTEKEKVEVEAELKRIKTESEKREADNQSLIKGLEDDLTRLKISNEQQNSRSKHIYERELASIRSQAERELTQQRSQFELDQITLKSSLEKEVLNKSQRITSLENRLKDALREKERLFEELQACQSEVESIRSKDDRLEAQIGELNHQLNQSNDQIQTLSEELDRLRKTSSSLSLSSSSSAKATATLIPSSSSSYREESELERTIKDLENQYALKLSSLNDRVIQLEKERNDVEQELSGSLRERLKEIERMRAEANQKSHDYGDNLTNMKNRNEERDRGIEELMKLKEKLSLAELTTNSQNLTIHNFKEEIDRLKEELTVAKQKQERLEEDQRQSLDREERLRANAQSIRDELRKVQNGILSNETKRGKGVGFFASFSNINSQQSPTKTSGSGNARTRTVTNSPKTPRIDTPSINSDSSKINNKDRTSSSSSISSVTSPSSSSSSVRSKRTLYKQKEDRGSDLNINQPTHDGQHQQRKTIKDDDNQDDDGEGDEAEVNFEYIRNTLLQFLEHKEMRVSNRGLDTLLFYFTENFGF